MTDKDIPDKPEKPKEKQRAKPRGADAPRNSGPRDKLLTPRMWMAARAAYESDLHATYASVAREFSISETSLERQARDERWLKRVDSMARMTERAHQIADRVGDALEAAGPEIDASKPGEPQTLPAEKKAEIQDAINLETGAEARAKVLDRHRKEWAAPRQLSYEAVKERNFDRAKLAKITSETLKIIQDGERKAWGLDAGGGEGVTVVIERD